MAESGNRWNSFLRSISRKMGVGSSSNPQPSSDTELEKLRETIDKIHELHFHTQLNKELCGYVDQKLLKLKLDSRCESFVRTPALLPNDQKLILRELYLVVKRVEVIVQKCTCNLDSPRQWLEAGITMANVEEHVMEMELDLAWWRRVLKIATESTVDEHEVLVKRIELAMKKQGTLLEKLSKEHSSLQKAAKRDRNDLLSRLADVKNTADTNSHEYLLAIYLLSRMQDGDDHIAPEVAVRLQEKDKGKSLGSGGYGRVYRVTWLENQECACKEIERGRLDPKKEHREYSILRRCNHPHILQFLWYWKDEEKSYIITERMPGDLNEHVSRRKLDLHVAIDVMLQIAKAMRYLNHHKIIHRDLKPSNVLVQPVTESLGESGYVHVKLGDFGTAKDYHKSQTSSEQTAGHGTTLYAAPEVIFGQQVGQEDGTPLRFPPKADVWSFSMVSYEVLSGKKPFHEEPQKGKIHAKIQKPNFRPVFPEDCPDYLKFCISSCWEQSPDKWPTFSEICTRLKLAKTLSLGITCFQPCTDLLPHKQPENQEVSRETVAPVPPEATLGDASIIRALVVRSSGTELLMKNLCFMNHNVPDDSRSNPDSISEVGLDINKEWKHCRALLRIHAASKCIGETGVFEHIQSFLERRNLLFTSSRWFEAWQEDLRIEDSRKWTH